MKTKTKKPSTESVLLEMLTENTGRALCDSGGTPKYDEKGKYVGSSGGYGRHYERNLGRDFKSEPASHLELSDYGNGRLGFTVTHNIFHWLNDRLVFSPKMDAQFRRFSKRKSMREEYETTVMAEFPKYLRARGFHVTGLYGDERQSFEADNSYNGDSMLSQVIQYTYFEADERAYVILQIHNGADVRGGYTSPRVFEVNLERHTDASVFMMVADGELVGYRPEGDPNQLLPGVKETLPDRIIWRTENAGHTWTLEDGGAFDARNRSLDEYPVTDDKGKIGQGYLVIDAEEGKMYCPITGWPLNASF